MKSDRALVLLSGGIDSAVVSIVAAQRHAYIHYLTFDYAQANRREIECALQIGRTLRKRGPHTLLPLDFSAVARSRRSSLLDRRPTGRKAEYGYYVPGRNMIFLAHATAIAESEGIRTIYIGSNLQDATGTPLQNGTGQTRGGYPDSGREFLRLAEAALNKGLKYGHQIRIEAPLLTMNKFEAVRYGHAHRFDFGATWSCYRNGARACGTCPACRARLLNFHWAGQVDPVRYATPYNTALSRALDLRAHGNLFASPSGGHATEGSVSRRRIGKKSRTLRVDVGIPHATETGVLDTLARAYALEPQRVSILRPAPGSPRPSAQHKSRRNGSSPDEIERLWHISLVSVDSYNYWKALGAARRQLVLRSQRNRLYAAG